MRTETIPARKRISRALYPRSKSLGIFEAVKISKELARETTRGHRRKVETNRRTRPHGGSRILDRRVGSRGTPSFGEERALEMLKRSARLPELRKEAERRTRKFRISRSQLGRTGYCEREHTDRETGRNVRGRRQMKQKERERDEKRQNEERR